MMTMSRKSRGSRLFYRGCAGMLVLATSMLRSQGLWAAPNESTAPDSSPADSKTAESTLDEIVVTAQKRSEPLQQVPIAITAVSGDTLQEHNITNVQSLAELLPNVRVNTLNTETRFVIRGITFESQVAQGGESRVAAHLDGVYLAQSGDIGGNLFDLDRIEVLRGPQGTLFGRNAVAGAINFITRDPTPDLNGYLQAAVGNYRQALFEGAVGGPITPGVSARIAFQTADQRGYAQDITTNTQIQDTHHRAVRLKLKFTPTDAFTVVLSADYFTESDHDGITFGRYLFADAVPFFGAVAADVNNPRNSLSDTTDSTNRQYYGFGSNASLKLTDNMTLVSVTGFRHGSTHYAFDSDETNQPQVSPSLAGDISREISQEFRLQTDFRRGNAMAGLYYFNQDYTGAVSTALDSGLFGLPLRLVEGSRFGGTQDTRAYALFAQAQYNITDPFKLIVGARYNIEQRYLIGAYNASSFAPFSVSQLCTQPCNVAHLPAGTTFTDGSTDFHNFSPKATLQYDFTPGVNAYVTYSQGFKSGGYSPGLQTTFFKPEKISDFEMGMKADLFGRLRVNAAAFYYDYKDLQVNQITAGEIALTIKNAAAAKLYGAEAEVVFKPTSSLQFNAGVAGMKSKFTSFLTSDPARPDGPNGDPNQPFNLAGNRLPDAPTYTADVGAQYTLSTGIGNWTLRGEDSAISNVFFDEFNVPRNSERAYQIVNAFLNYSSADGGYYGSLFVRNLGNVDRWNGSTQGGTFQGYVLQVTRTAPRTFGLTFGRRF